MREDHGDGGEGVPDERLAQAQTPRELVSVRIQGVVVHLGHI